MSKLITIWPPDTDEEIQLKMEIAELHKEFQEKVKPLTDKLTKINATKTPRLVIVGTGKIEL